MRSAGEEKDFLSSTKRETVKSDELSEIKTEYIGKGLTIKIKNSKSCERSLTHESADLGKR